MKTGLIMEGGAMRGLFTAGVIDVMMENGIRYDGAIGVSAGAAFGCNYKSGQIGRVLRYNLRFGRDRRYAGLGPMAREGNVFSADFCYGEVPLKLDPFDFQAFHQNPMEFYVVCTDVMTGKAVYHRYEGWEDHGFDWIQASASMPLVSRMVEIEGKKLLDGGIADSIPVEYFRSIGYEKNVAILTQAAGYRKEPSRAMALIRQKYWRYPRLVEAMEHRHEMYNRELDQAAREEAAGALFVIRPQGPLNVSRLEKDPVKLRGAYNAGRRAMEEKLEDLRAFLGQTTAETPEDPGKGEE